MRFAIVVLGLVVFVSTVDAQRIYTQAAKIDSGSVYYVAAGPSYHSHAEKYIGYRPYPLYAMFRAYYVFDATALPAAGMVARVRMEYGTGQTYAGDTVRALILPNWQHGNPEEAYNGIGEGIQVDAYPTPYSSTITRSFDITSAEALNALYSGDSIAFGFILEPTPDHSITIVSARLHIEYCGGATATLTVNNVIEAGIEYAGSNSLVRMGAGEFLEPPLAREALLGADIACEVWNARYDSTTTGLPMKPFLWQMWEDRLPPTYTVLNYDTSSMANEYTSYAWEIIPASISSVDEFDGGLNVEVFFKDPWRITQEDSVQTREGDYLPHVTPYSTATDATTFGVFTGIDPGAYPEVYSLMVPVAVDSIGTTILSDTLHVLDRVFAGIAVTPGDAAAFSSGERVGHYMKYDIIFLGESADIAVTYKHHRNSKGQALSAQSQRNICHDIFGRYHMAYSDLGEIWYTTSPDGINWRPEKRVSSGMGLAANPSVRSAQSKYGTHSYHPVYITFAENESIVLVSIDDEGKDHVVWYSPPISTQSLHPSVASDFMCSQPFVLVAYETLSGIAYMVAKLDYLVQDSLDFFQIGEPVYGAFPGASHPALDSKGVITWRNQDTVMINMYHQNCLPFDFTWNQSGPVKLHVPTDGIVLSPPSIAREYSQDPNPKCYITYSVTDTTNYPPEYAGIPGLHCVVVQTYDISIGSVITKRKFVYPPHSQGIYIEEDGQPVVLNVAKPTVGSYRNHPGARVVYQSIFVNDRIDVLEVSPDLDTICHAQSDGGNPGICLAATLGDLREALTVGGSNWTQTIETSDLYLNKRREVIFESVQSFGCESTPTTQPTLFLKIAGASVSSSSEHRIVPTPLDHAKKAFSFVPGDDGRISIDYFYSGDRCIVEIIQYRNGDRNTCVTVFKSSLIHTNGEWRSQHWNLSNILEPFRQYGIIIHADGCDLTRSREMIIPVAHHGEAPREETPTTGCAVNITSINPNPAQDMVTVTTSSSYDGALVMVLSDVFGSFSRIIATGWHSNGIHVIPIDTSDLASGVYSIRLLHEQCTISRQFVIER